MPFPEKISSPICRVSLRRKYGGIHPFISFYCHFFPSRYSFFPPFSFSSFSPLASSSHSSNHWGTKLITFSVFYTEVNKSVLKLVASANRSRNKRSTQGRKSHQRNRWSSEHHSISLPFSTLNSFFLHLDPHPGIASHTILQVML